MRGKVPDFHDALTQLYVNPPMIKKGRGCDTPISPGHHVPACHQMATTDGLEAIE